MSWWVSRDFYCLAYRYVKLMSHVEQPGLVLVLSNPMRIEPCPWMVYVHHHPLLQCLSSSSSVSPHPERHQQLLPTRYPQRSDSYSEQHLTDPGSSLGWISFSCTYTHNHQGFNSQIWIVEGGRDCTDSCHSYWMFIPNHKVGKFSSSCPFSGPSLPPSSPPPTLSMIFAL